jgi:hypothetical protein
MTTHQQELEERIADPELSGLLLLIGLICLGLVLVILAT